MSNDQHRKQIESLQARLRASHMVVTDYTNRAASAREEAATLHNRLARFRGLSRIRRLLAAWKNEV